MNLKGFKYTKEDEITFRIGKQKSTASRTEESSVREESRLDHYLCDGSILNICLNTVVAPVPFPPNEVTTLGFAIHKKFYILAISLRRRGGALVEDLEVVGVMEPRLESGFGQAQGERVQSNTSPPSSTRTTFYKNDPDSLILFDGSLEDLLHDNGAGLRGGRGMRNGVPPPCLGIFTCVCAFTKPSEEASRSRASFGLNHLMVYW
ncbi:carboxyl transferase [Striga asiatica]|uniref:Carboxyl transferase n=1 Tax=Striga asiatica TaxID=4170 RepID=A0A5A7PIP1_STRAF|nr:carboxyl transferase [Striga asiatica]